MMELNFLSEKKILAGLKKRTIFVLMCFVTKIGWLFQFTFQIKDFNRSMFYKTKNKNKKYFCKSCLQCFSSKKILTEHKEVCLSINGAQSVRLEKGTIEFKNYFKQIPVPFKIYTDFECNLKSVENYGGSWKKYQDHIPCSFAYKLVCVDDEFTKPIVVFKGENAAYKFIEAILKEYCKKVMKKTL